MRATGLNRTSVVAVAALLTLPLCLAAQEDSESRPTHARHYKITDLGAPDGSTFSQASTISDRGVISGLAAPTQTNPQHAVVWEPGKILEFGTLGGLNSAAFGAVKQGRRVVAVGQAESADLDPKDENFCGYGTHEKCLPVLWDGHATIPLPTLGGNNGFAGPINARGEVAGTVETDVRDPDCPGTVAVNGTGPQLLDYQGVVWGPKLGQMRKLKPLADDTVSIAVWINDNGQAVGISGTCANSVIPPIAYGPHAVLWDRHGNPHDLGNLGSTVANVGLSINNRGEVVGASSPTDQSTNLNGVLAFLWSQQKGMRSLGTLPGDFASGATGINDRGEVVGLSIDPMGNPRAVVWLNTSIYNLNDLVIGDSPFEALLASFGGINDAGEIVGFGVTTGGDVHAFLATPCNETEVSERVTSGSKHEPVIPEYVRDMVRARFGMHGH
ncbi:MAG: hypothetical protein ACJ74Y_11755 [Bryobacteraceae bacterium]